MGSITRSDRAERFIQEFNTDFTGDVEGGRTFQLVSASLGFSEGEDVVRIFYEFRTPDGKSLELMNPSVAFDPARAGEYEVGSVAHALGLEDPEDLDVLVERLKSADLLDQDFAFSEAP